MRIKVATPCNARWDEMTGDERKRYCAACGLDVFNLSGMTPEEAMSFFQEARGRTCARLYLRTDGTVLTADCPVGLAKARRRVAVALTAVIALLITGVRWVSAATSGDDRSDSTFGARVRARKTLVRRVEPMRSILNALDPELKVTMGMVAPRAAPRKEPEP